MSQPKSQPKSQPNSPTLAERLAPFIDAGLVAELPTAEQIRLAELEMLPYVVSTDATHTDGYAGKPLGHPILRQPLIASQVGLDHFRIGLGLRVSRASIITHLHLTFHSGMPVFDLQLLQTHAGGLDSLRTETEALLAGSTGRARRIGRLSRLILADPHTYHSRFLGPDGWIARAERFAYPDPAEEDAAFPREFFSLIDFVNYASKLPQATSPWQKPRQLLHHVGRRFREGRRLGWFSAAS